MSIDYRYIVTYTLRKRNLIIFVVRHFTLFLMCVHVIVKNTENIAEQKEINDKKICMYIMP